MGVFSVVFWLLALLPPPANPKTAKQRANIKFLLHAGNTPIQIWRGLEAVYGDQVMSKSAVRFWCRRLRTGDINSSLQDKKRSGRPRSVRTAAKIQSVQEYLQVNGRKTISDVAAKVNVSRSTAHKIMKKDLKLSKLCPKFVPRILTEEQNHARVTMSEQNLRRCLEETDFLARIITGDESWVSVFEMELKKNSLVWMRGGRQVIRPQKALRNRSVKKVMITVFFYCRGVILAEFKDPKDKICQETYCETLKVLRDKIRRKRPELWRGGRGNSRYLIHHDNAPPHTSVLTLAFLGEHDMEMVAHPPYSPDLAPCDFFLFPRLKEVLRGHRFPSVAAMKQGVLSALKKIDKDEFRKAIDNMAVRWIKCVELKGDYFEGRHVSVAPTETDSESEEENIQFSLQDDDEGPSEPDIDS